MNKDLNKMTFKELKTVLNKCISPEKCMIIRMLMRNIYRSYIQQKKISKRQRVIHTKHSSSQISDEELVNEILMERGRPKVQKNSKYTPPDFIENKKKFEKEINSDHLNNGLTNRMNNELLIRKNKAKRDFVPPFTSANGSKYAPYSELGDGITDFSTRMK